MELFCKLDSETSFPIRDPAPIPEPWPLPTPAQVYTIPPQMKAEPEAASMSDIATQTNFRAYTSQPSHLGSRTPL
ncbi:unnamed protein product [Caenorhabditis sp. 36 PRJEB53466]|nr:unnamed protein product [Caenorhabditis sp. 36 PRJEB53466]